MIHERVSNYLTDGPSLASDARTVVSVPLLPLLPWSRLLPPRLPVPEAPAPGPGLGLAPGPVLLSVTLGVAVRPGLAPEAGLVFGLEEVVPWLGLPSEAGIGRGRGSGAGVGTVVVSTITLAMPVPPVPVPKVKPLVVKPLVVMPAVVVVMAAMPVPGMGTPVGVGTPVVAEIGVEVGVVVVEIGVVDPSPFSRI